MYEFEEARVTVPVPPSTMRSELALDPVMAPLTVMPPVPPWSLRMLPFLPTVPESVSRLPEALVMIPVEPVETVTPLVRLITPLPV